MQVHRPECPLVLHDCQDHKELEDLLREMSKLLQIVHQAGEDLHGAVYQDPLEVCLPLFRHHLLRSLLPCSRFLPKIAAGKVAARPEEDCQW
jgi:hypothetical protein